MDSQCTPSVRDLFAWEVHEARRVFANGLIYERVRVHECTTWPNKVHRLGMWVQGQPYSGIPNAITLGNNCYFPVRLLSTNVPADNPEFYKLPWLMHELTHAWQYQHMGWGYLLKALGTQIRHGAAAYNFGGEEGLLERRLEGWAFNNFNLEEQGEIASSYYKQLVRGADVNAWMPFIAEIQGTNPA
jgi:hypothetical protein